MAYAYCRVLGGCVFLQVRYLCTDATEKTTCPTQALPTLPKPYRRYPDRRQDAAGAERADGSQVCHGTQGSQDPRRSVHLLEARDQNITKLLHRNVKGFRGGLMFKARRLLYHLPLGLRAIKKKRSYYKTGPFIKVSRRSRPSARFVLSVLSVPVLSVWAR